MKIRNIVIILIISIAVGGLTIGIIRHIRVTNERKQQELYKYFLWEDREYELIEKVCEKNGNWENYPLSKNFLSKYNAKDGFFGDLKFDKVEVYPYRDVEGGDFLSCAPHIRISKNNDIIIYLYTPKFVEGEGLSYSVLDDIELTEPIIVHPGSDGNFEYKRPFNKSYIKENLSDLTSNDKRYINAVALTEHFKNKYPFFIDLFIHYSPLSYNRISRVSSQSDLENNIAIFEVDSILECKKRKYKVKLILDDKLYLDDCDVELLEEMAYEGDHKNSSAKAFYLHSNLENTTLTDEFIERLKAKGSYFDDIDNIDIDYIVDEAFVKNNDTDIIRCYKMKDGTINSYYVKYNYNDNKKISNIIPIKLEYTNMSAEEVAKLYLDSIKETKKE